MMKDKKLIYGILVIAVLAIAGIGLFVLNRPSTTPTPTQEITITTDKLEYEQGEPIKITVRNGLDAPILYYDGEQFWSVEYLEDGRWKNPAYERGGGFQLTKENINDACYIRLYERMPPIEMKANSVLSQQWNQRICPFGEEDPGKPRFVKYIGVGHYRLIFYYGFEISSEDTYKIKEGKTVYSNEFTIKHVQNKENSETKNLQIDCLGTCRCMEECNEEGPTYFIPADEGSQECSVNPINKICCCSGV